MKEVKPDQELGSQDNVFREWESNRNENWIWIAGLISS
jgi:hypothetical protein